MGFKSFGKKLRHSAKKTFGKKTQHKLKEFGKKALHQADIVERKVVNSIDKAAVPLAIASDAFVPGSGEAVLKANDGLQSLHHSGRELIKKIPKLGVKQSRDGRNKQVADFGDGINKVKEDFNRSKGLLRNVKNNYK